MSIILLGVLLTTVAFVLVAFTAFLMYSVSMTHNTIPPQWPFLVGLLYAASIVLSISHTKEMIGLSAITIIFYLLYLFYAFIFSDWNK